MNENATDLADFLANAAMDAAEEQDRNFTVQSYEFAGPRPSYAGFVVRLADGTEFQVTVVQSR